jgi:hypothetical protein
MLGSLAIRRARLSFDFEPNIAGTAIAWDKRTALVLLSHRTDSGVHACNHAAVGRSIQSRRRGVHGADTDFHRLKLHSRDLNRQFQVLQIPSSSTL